MDAARSSVPTAGTLVAGRYRVGHPIGEGGMGVVLAARDEREVKDVALKLLQVVGEANIERFLREARLVTKLASDHVVKVLDVGNLGQMPFIIMERLEGEDYGAKVRDVGALSLPHVADCVVQTCEALAHAHGIGIVHRDVKASNLFEHRMADGSRIVKVLDFGISKMIAGGTAPEVERTLTRTRDGGFLGSPPYMSPEHVKDPRNVDGRADLWSLGVVAYRLLSTRFPFPGETTGEVLAAILESRPAKLRSFGVEVPEEVDLIIDRCLKRDRDDRFPDAGALARAFAKYASPKWRGYAERVPQIVATSSIPSPANDLTTRRRKRVVEPSTATVPPPLHDPPTLAFEEIQASLPTDITGPMRIVEAVPSPLEVLSSGPMPLMRAPAPAPRRWPIVVFALLLAVGALSSYVVITRLKARATPAPTATTEPSTTMSTVAAPAPAPAPAKSETVATAEPAAAPAPAPDQHPTGRAKPGRPVRPAPTPKPAPAPHEAPAPKKPDLEPSPYGKQ